jgi:hypothetical protein
MKRIPFAYIFPPCKESNSSEVKYGSWWATLYKSKVCSVNINCIDVGALEMFQKINSLPSSISKGNNILVWFVAWETKTHGRKKHSLNYHDEEVTGVNRHLQMGLRYTP